MSPSRDKISLDERRITGTTSPGGEGKGRKHCPFHLLSKMFVLMLY
jgi:hypothetical protein